MTGEVNRGFAKVRSPTGGGQNVAERMIEANGVVLCTEVSVGLTTRPFS